MNKKQYCLHYVGVKMQLLKPHFTTSRYTTKKNKPSSLQMKKWQESYKETCKQNKRLGLPNTTFDEYLNTVCGKVEIQKKKRSLIPDPIIADIRKHQEQYPSLGMKNVSSDATAKKEPNVYTGNLIIGIADCHKSNAVPVIRKEQIEEISRMRR